MVEQPPQQPAPFAANLLQQAPKCHAADSAAVQGFRG